MIFLGACVERWSGWLFMGMLLLSIMVATYLPNRKKSRSRS
jgi:hypothetical protein